MKTFLWPLNTHGGPKTRCLLGQPAPPRVSHREPSEGRPVPAKSRPGVPVTATQFTATQRLTAHAGHLSPQETHLPGPRRAPPHTHTKKKVILTSLVWKNTRYSAHSWNGGFLPFPGGMFSQRQKCVRAAEKIHLCARAPLLGNFQLYISNYGCQLMGSEKTFCVPPPLFCLFVISSVRMIIAHLHN